MSVKVFNRNVMIAPRKIRAVADLVRGQKVSEAIRVLRFNEKKEIALVLTKLLNSGLAIASEREKYDLENLFVTSIMINEGPMMKRIMPRAQGRAFRVRHRSSHISVELREK